MTTSDPTPPAADPQHNSPETKPTDHQDQPDSAAEAARWKAASRRWEDQAKANAKAAEKLAALEASMQTDQERAIGEAKTQTRAEVLREVGGERVRDAARVAFAGRQVDVDALLEGLATDPFLNDDGTPNVAKVKEWADRIAPQQDPRDPQPPPSVQRGPRTPPSAHNEPAAKFATFLDDAMRRR